MQAQNNEIIFKDKKMVCVPQKDIDALEEARMLLYKAFPTTTDIMKLTAISKAMWEITHRKYKEVTK